MALCPIAMIPGVLRSESSMPNWISIIFGRNISQEAGKEGGKQERWYNFPPRLSSGALPCKTGNVEITSFRFRWKTMLSFTTCLIAVDICRDTVVKYFIDCFHRLACLPKKTPITDMAPDIMADVANADCVHIRWLDALCQCCVVWRTQLSEG